MEQGPGQQQSFASHQWAAPLSATTTGPDTAAARDVDPHRFVQDVQPILARQDTAGLLRLLASRYTPERIYGLLNSPDDDARKVAALALALVGGPEAIPPLAEHLRDLDPMVNEMAEHALWSIWFRGGTPEANAHLVRGSEALERRDLQRAIEHFSAAIALCPDFAEAYNQRAIAFFLQERFEESLRDGRRAVELMPCHFGAWAGMGHCHANRREFEATLNCYRRALSINPHLQCVSEMISALQSRQDDEIEEWSESWSPGCVGKKCDERGA